MKWCRFLAGERVSYGVVDDERVTEVAGSPFAEHAATGTSHPLGRVKLLPPVIPPMLYAAGPNYRGHVEGMARRRGAAPQYPARPEPNFRSVHALIGPEDKIVVPKDCAGAVQPDGPWIVTDLDPAKFRIVVRHNGAVWEDFSSGDQIWDTATWIQELSRYTTLHPGDVLWMGTQGADGDMVPGDVIEVEISGIGTLRNYVVAEG